VQLCDCRPDGGNEVLDVATDILADQLKEIIVWCYKTEVMVDSDKVKSFELTTKITAMIW